MNALTIVASLMMLVGVAFAFGPWLAGYRTMIFNGISLALVPSMELLNYFETVDWRQYLPPEYAPWAILAISAVNIVLRWKTTTPVGVPPGP